MELIEASKLKVSADNARQTKTDKSQDDELKASIKAKGLLQNVVVGPENPVTGIHQVYAGGRRLNAIIDLIKEGHLDQEFRVPCMVVEEGADAAEASLVENTMRASMHIVDELHAYRELIEKHGYTNEDLSNRFGKPVKEIDKVLALSAVSPKLLAKCKAGDIDLDTLKAFTLEPDHKKQMEVYKAATNDGRWEPNSWQVKDLITDDAVRASDSLAKFVGIKNYEKAGGATSSDLFGDESYIADAVLLQNLANEKIAKAKEKLEAEGWSSVEFQENFQEYQIDYGDLKQKKGNYDAAPADLLESIATLEAELKELAGKKDQESRKARGGKKKELMKLTKKKAKYHDYSDAEKKASYCIITISYAGRLETFKGVYLKKAKAGKAGQAGSKSSPSPVEKGYSDKLKTDLALVRHSVARAVLAKDEGIGTDLVLFSVVWDAVKDFSFDSPLSITVQDKGPGLTATSVDNELAALAVLSKARDELDLFWMEVDDAEASFKNFRELDQLDIRPLLAYAAAYSLINEGYSKKTPFTDLILEETNTNVAEYWRPTASNFFSRISIPLLTAAGEEIFDDMTWAEQNGKTKKGVLVEMVSDKAASMEVEDCWLPPMKEI